MVYSRLIGFFKGLRKYQWSYVRRLNDDTDICQSLEAVRDGIIKSGLEVQVLSYDNQDSLFGKHCLKGVLNKDNHFEIRAYFMYLTPQANYIRLSAERGDDKTEELRSIIDKIQ